MVTNQYCVVLGDVVDSREIDDRISFQNRIEKVLTKVNKRHEESVYAPFTLLKGVDEIGGVLTSVSPIVEIQREIARAIHPEQIRLAVVVGGIDVNVNSKDVSEMDGRAFARADMSLLEIEEDNLTFHLSGVEPTIDGFISDEINLLDMIRSEWSERKMEVISKFQELDTQKMVAESLDISTQAVSNHLNESNVREVLEIENRLIERLELYPSIDTES